MTAIWSATTGAADGAHVVLVHGSLDRSAGLLKLSRRLDERHRVTRYDRRGYGRSRAVDGPFDMAAQVGDLLDVIETSAHDVRPRVVVGHSYGGTVALALASQRPDLVDGVITYESPMSWKPWWSGSSSQADPAEWRRDPELAAERFMRRLIGDERWERLPPSTRASRRAEGPAMVGELLDLKRHAPWDPDRIAVPVLALHGALGRDHHRRAAETIADEIDGARAAAVPGAAHPGPNTHPDETARIVVDFVAQIAA